MTNKLLFRLLLFTFSLICISSALTETARAEPDKFTLKELELRGPVKSMEISPTFGGALKEIYLFNEAGNLTEHTVFDRIEGPPIRKIVNHYDRAGRIISSEIFFNGKLEYKSAFLSDEMGNIIERTDRRSDDKPEARTVYQYDKNGNLIEENVQYVKGPNTPGLPDRLPLIDVKTVYERDENGDPKRIRTFFPGQKMPATDQSFVYNRDHQKIESGEILRTYADVPPTIRRTFYRYNEQGDLIESKTYESIKESNVEEYKGKFKIIDDRGTVQLRRTISDKPYMILWFVSAYQYQYDARNNWTRRIDKPKPGAAGDSTAPGGRIPSRTFTYY